MPRPPVAFSQLDENDLRHVLEFPANAPPEQNVAREWTWQHLLSSLTPDEQALAYWYYVRDETMAEIAARMNLSDPVVHLIHSRMCDKLRARLKSRERAA